MLEYVCISVLEEAVSEGLELGGSTKSDGSEGT